MSGTPLDCFLSIARRPAASDDLAEAALWIAAEAQPSVEVDAYQARLASLAESAAPQVLDVESCSGKVERLNDFLFVQEGFAGNADDYYDPRNSYLSEVLDRRLGIPITLAIVWIDVARRLGIDAHGVSFPGHFLAMARGQGEADVIVDPFAGRAIDEARCRTLLRLRGDETEDFQPRLLSPAPAIEVLARVLRNLKQIHLQRRQLTSALSCCDWLLALLPDTPHELRDRGFVHRALECWLSAREDLERYVAMEPGAPDLTKIRAVLTDLERRTARLH